jgi:hypothetical protein
MDKIVENPARKDVVVTGYPPELNFLNAKSTF